MSDLPLIVTNAGRAALINAAHNGTAPVTIASVGVSATQITASTTTAALPGEIKRIATIAGDVVAADTIHLIVRDDTNAVYSVRSFALYLNDGTLFAAYGQAGVIIEKSSLALLLLALDVRFADVAATQLVFGNANFLNPPATEAAPGVIELATLDEAAAGFDAVRAITPKTAKASVPAWLGYTPANRAGDIFTGPIGRDQTFYMNVQDGYAVLSFDPNDYQSYQRTTNTYELIIGGVSRLRVNSTTVAIGGQTVWHAGNDGAGSGLDADLLDGQHGSWYADIPGRLGYQPANRAGDIFTGPIGRDANYYLDFDGSNPIINFAPSRYLRFARAGDTYDFVIGNTARLSISSVAVTIAGQTVWHAGNDGAGSGCDADLLDGQHGNWYTDIAGRLGYQPANRAGDIFTGPIARDSLFSLDLAGSNPLIALGSNRYLIFDRATDTLSLVLGGAVIWSVNGSAVRFAGAPLWHAGNDGAGSGCDADLLDGQQGNWYTDIAGRLGYQPANRGGDLFTGSVSIAHAGSPGISLNSIGKVIGRLVAQSDGGIVLYRDDGTTAAPIFTVYNQSGPFAVQMPITRSGNVVWDAGNDGAGSGADADLLDGQQGNWYADIAGRLGYQPANRGGDIFTGNVTLAYAGSPSLTLNSAGAVVARLAAQSDGNVVLYRNVGAGDVPIFAIGSQAGPFAVQMPITRSGNAVWDAGNDGSGSGLDADMLDGHHASDFATPEQFASLINDNGYQRLPGGLLLQWGIVGIPAGTTGYVDVQFPIVFPNRCFNAVACNGAGGSTSAPTAWASTGNFAKGSMRVGMSSASGVGAPAGTAAYWFAIGY